MGERSINEIMDDMTRLGQAVVHALSMIDSRREREFYPGARRGAELVTQLLKMLSSSPASAVSASGQGAELGATRWLPRVLKPLDGYVTQLWQQAPLQRQVKGERAGSISEQNLLALVAQDTPTLPAPITRLLETAFEAGEAPEFYEGVVNGADAMAAGAAKLGFEGESFATAIAAIRIAAAKAWFISESGRGS
jgi:hypothetical protein